MSEGTPPAFPRPVESSILRNARLSGLGWPNSLDEIRFRDIATAVLVALTIWAYVDVGPHGRIERGKLALHRTDFTVYTEAGAAFFDGRDPYGVTNPRGWYYLYPPLFALIVSPLNAFDTESQVIIWYVVSIALAFGCYSEARRLWSTLAPAPTSASRARRFSVSFAQWVGGCALLAAILPALDCLQRGQLGIAILYTLLLGFRLALEGGSRTRFILSGVILAFPACLKLVPLLPVGFLAFQKWIAGLFGTERRPRIAQAATLSTGMFAGALFFLFLFPAAFVGWQKNLQYLQRWTERVVANERIGATAKFDIHSPRNQSLANAVLLLDESLRGPVPRRGLKRDQARRLVVRSGNRNVQVANLLALAVLLGLGVMVARRDDPLDLAANFGLACCATLLVSPLSWGHYYMMTLPAVLFVPLRLARLGAWTSAAVLAVIPGVLTWAHYVALRQTGRLGVLGIGTALWFFAACFAIVLAEAYVRVPGRTSLLDAPLEGRLDGPEAARILGSRRPAVFQSMLSRREGRRSGPSA